MKNAISGTYPSAATVDVTWTDNSGSESASATDKALILIYNVDKMKGYLPPLDQQGQLEQKVFPYQLNTLVIVLRYS